MDQTSTTAARKGKTEVLTGIARARGKAAGEALVNSQRMGWAFNHVDNETGIVTVPGADILGKCVQDKIVVYPTVLGSTSAACSLYFKCKESHHGPAAIICQQVHWIDISGVSEPPIWIGANKRHRSAHRRASEPSIYLR